MSEARKVFLAIPVHDQTVCASLFVSLFTDVAACTAKGYRFFVLCHGQDSNPAHARNLILAQFLASDCSDLVSIDRDISWPPGTLERILSHPVDFVGGTYRFKREKEGYPIWWVGDHNDARDANGLVPVKRLPGGFMRMTRTGVERVIATLKPQQFRSHFAGGVDCHYLYHEKIEDNGLVTEDYVFCDYVREAGETLYLDPQLKLDHSGQATYSGNIDAFIAGLNNKALPEARRKEYEEKCIRFAESLSTPEMLRTLEAAIGKAA